MTIEERLSRLERRYRLAVVLVAVLTAGLVWSLAGQASIMAVAAQVDARPVVKLIRANQIEIVDEEGRARVELAADLDSPRLRLMDPNGHSRVLLQLFTAKLPMLRMMGQNGKDRVTLLATEKVGMVEVSNREGKGVQSMP